MRKFIEYEDTEKGCPSTVYVVLSVLKPILQDRTQFKTIKKLVTILAAMEYSFYQGQPNENSFFRNSTLGAICYKQFVYTLIAEKKVQSEEIHQSVLPQTLSISLKQGMWGFFSKIAQTYIGQLKTNPIDSYLKRDKDNIDTVENLWKYIQLILCLRSWEKEGQLPCVQPFKDFFLQPDVSELKIPVNDILKQATTRQILLKPALNCLAQWGVHPNVTVKKQAFLLEFVLTRLNTATQDTPVLLFALKWHLDCLSWHLKMSNQSFSEEERRGFSQRIVSLQESLMVTNSKVRLIKQFSTVCEYSRNIPSISNQITCAEEKIKALGNQIDSVALDKNWYSATLPLHQRKGALTKQLAVLKQSKASIQDKAEHPFRTIEMQSLESASKTHSAAPH